MKTRRVAKVCSMLLAFVLGGDAVLAAAAPAPGPSGANQTSGGSGVAHGRIPNEAELLLMVDAFLGIPEPNGPSP